MVKPFLLRSEIAKPPNRSGLELVTVNVVVAVGARRWLISAECEFSVSARDTAVNTKEFLESFLRSYSVHLCTAASAATYCNILLRFS